MLLLPWKKQRKKNCDDDWCVNLQEDKCCNKMKATSNERDSMVLKEHDNAMLLAHVDANKEIKQWDAKEKLKKNRQHRNKWCFHHHESFKKHKIMTMIVVLTYKNKEK